MGVEVQRGQVVLVMELVWVTVGVLVVQSSVLVTVVYEVT